RLFRCGYKLLMTDLPRPTAIRRTVSFCQAVYDGVMTLEGVTARLAGRGDFTRIIAAGEIPVVPDAEQDWLDSLDAAALIEATLAKHNTGISRKPGRATIALGPGYTAGREADAVVETSRGHYLGRVILDGQALPNTGKPGLIGGYDKERLIKLPVGGLVNFTSAIGEKVSAGQILGKVGEANIVAAIDGILRGALTNGLTVPENFKIGDIDPRPEAADFIHTPSDKARAIAGGVLEALLYFGVKP
ncbi:EF2563 family selenium-dependent molybdenum hydroxylase system protein, partial [Deltaproteobacteria bacterium OttesenSCG-928-K17]|nr:EF2563 family selenium-dependent molybdenum hydroxylase system protein [Deltaproteobacteria bacterium OttesenSCG-928-K17]